MKTSRRLAIVVLLVGGLVGCGASSTEPALTQLARAPEKSASSKIAKPAPEPHEVRKEVVTTSTTGIPAVLLTKEHSAMCRVRVGDQLPVMKLPLAKGGEADLASLRGKQATVVLFWQDDPWMSATALQDLASEITPSEDVAVVGIAVRQPNAELASAVEKSGAKFTQLVDSDGKAFERVGMTKMPRVYVLDGSGKIVWFDIEYSQSTSRELQQTLATLAGGQ